MNYLFLSIFTFLFIGCSFNGNIVRKNNLNTKIHVVKKGDTIKKIAHNYGVSNQELVLTNNIHTRLKIGQKIHIPTKKNLHIKKVQVKQEKVIKNIVSAKEKSLLFPVKNGSIIKGFSRTKKDPYDGIAIKAQLGSKVFAASEGKVIFVGDDNTTFGLLIIIEHKNKLVTVYTHLQKALVNEKQLVKKGQVIGLVGKPKESNTPLLHFQVRKEQAPQDPKLFFN